MKILKKTVCVLLCAVLLLGVLGGCDKLLGTSAPESESSAPAEKPVSSSGKKEPEKAAEPYKIGMIQYSSGPEEEMLRQAFLNRLEEWGCSKETVNIEYQNAQGDRAKAENICKKFVENGVDLIVSISSPASEIAVEIAQGTDTGVVFAGMQLLSENKTSSWEKITGIMENPVPEKVVDLALKADPKIKTFGVIYDGTDSGAQTSAARFKAYCSSLNIQVEEAAVSGAADIPKALKDLCAKSEALFTPIGGKVNLSAGEIAKTCREVLRPWYTDSSTLVQSGALAAVCTDREQLGRDAADMAASMIAGKYPGQFVIARDSKVFINQTNLNDLQTAIPDDVLAGAYFFGN